MLLLLLLEIGGPLPSRTAVSIKSTMSGVPADCPVAESDADTEAGNGIAMLVLSDPCPPLFEGGSVLLESVGGIPPLAGMGAARDFAATTADSYEIYENLVRRVLQYKSHRATPLYVTATT